MTIQINHIRLIAYSLILAFAALIFFMFHVVAQNHPDYYANCSEAKAKHDTNIPKSSKYYRPELDRDHDGYACEG